MWRGAKRRPGPRRPAASSLPILPLAAAACVLVAAAQVGVWVWQAQQPKAEKYVAAGNPFVAFTQQFRTLAQQKNAQENSQRLSIPTNPANLVLKDPQGTTVLTVLTDPACTRCRQQVAMWLAQVPATGTRVEVKFWPENPRRLTGGLVLALAQRYGTHEALWKALQADLKTDLTDTELLSKLAATGVSFGVIRQALEMNNSPLLQTLEPDLAWATQQGLGAPPLAFRAGLPFARE